MTSPPSSQLPLIFLCKRLLAQYKSPSLPLPFDTLFTLTDDITQAKYIVLNNILGQAFADYRTLYGCGLVEGHVLLREEWLSLVCKTGKLIETDPWTLRFFEGCKVLFSRDLMYEEKSVTHGKYESLLKLHGAEVYKMPLHSSTSDSSASDLRAISHVVVKQRLRSSDKEFIKQLRLSGCRDLRIVTANWIDDTLVQELACAEETYELPLEDFLSGMFSQDSAGQQHAARSPRTSKSRGADEGALLFEDSETHTRGRNHSPSTSTNTMQGRDFSVHPLSSTQPSHLQSRQYLSSCRILLVGFSRSGKKSIYSDIMDSGAVNIPFYFPNQFSSNFLTHVIVNTSNQKRFTHDDWAVLSSFTDTIRYQRENKERMMASSSRYEGCPHVVSDSWLTLSMVSRKHCEESDYLFTLDPEQFREQCKSSSNGGGRRRYRNANVFEGVNFFILKGDSADIAKYDNIEKLISQNGGVFVSEKAADFAVVPPVQAFTGSFTMAKQEVTPYWVVQCVQDARLHPSEKDVLFRPISTDCQNNFISNAQICTCGIHGEKKARLKQMVRHLEGRLDPTLRPKRTDVLLCASIFQKIDESPAKYQRCLKVGIPIVKPEWVQESILQGHFIDPSPFMHPLSVEHERRRRQKIQQKRERARLAKLEKKKELEEKRRKRQERIDRQIETSYRHNAAHSTAIRKKQMITMPDEDNDVHLPDIEIVEHSPDEDEMDDKREIPEDFKKKMRRKRARKHSEEQGTSSRKRRRVQREEESGDFVPEPHPNRRSHQGKVSDARTPRRHHHSTTKQNGFEDEIEDLLGDDMPPVPAPLPDAAAEGETNRESKDTASAAGKQTNALLPNAPGQKELDDSHSEQGDSDNDSDLESEASSSSQGSMDVQSLQQIIDDFPEIKPQQVAQNTARTNTNQITRAQLRQPYSELSDNIPAALPNAPDRHTENATLSQSHVNAGNKSTQKLNNPQAFHQSQRIGWKGGTQVATQYNNIVFRVAVSNDPDRNALMEMVEYLGGEPADEAGDMTHLVCKQLKKTAKVLSAIVSKTEILHPDWIIESNQNGEWLPSIEYHWSNPKYDSLFDDQSDLSRSVRRAIELHRKLKRPVFDGMRFQIMMPQPKKAALTGILCEGGAIPTESSSEVEYLFISQSDVPKLLEVLHKHKQLHPQSLIVDMKDIAKKVMSPSYEFTEIRLPKLPKPGRVEAIESDSDDLSDVQVVQTTTVRRVHRKKRRTGV